MNGGVRTVGMLTECRFSHSIGVSSKYPANSSAGILFEIMARVCFNFHVTLASHLAPDTRCLLISIWQHLLAHSLQLDHAFSPWGALFGNASGGQFEKF